MGSLTKSDLSGSVGGAMVDHNASKQIPPIGRVGREKIEIIIFRARNNTRQLRRVHFDQDVKALNDAARHLIARLAYENPSGNLQTEREHLVSKGKKMAHLISAQLISRFEGWLAYRASISPA
jgi:hypothetical protein